MVVGSVPSGPVLVLKKRRIMLKKGGGSCTGTHPNREQRRVFGSTRSGPGTHCVRASLSFYSIKISCFWSYESVRHSKLKESNLHQTHVCTFRKKTFYQNKTAALQTAESCGLKHQDVNH